jgi:DNA replication and repair protein RecF
MRLLSLNLEDFRNVANANLTISGDRVFFLGPNGQGKTNLLEAIGLAGSLRSFRKSGMDGLVREGQSRSQSYYRFLDDNGDEREVFLSFRTKGEKNLEVDGERVNRLGGHLGQFPAVTLSSRDFRLIREGPSDRRKWLDLLLSSSSLEYFNNLQGYTRSLRERNVLLKREARDGELLAFEQSLAQCAVALHIFRAKSIPLISQSLALSYSSLTDKAEKADLQYAPDLSIESVEEYLQKLADERPRDRIMGSTRKGPHRDDFLFRLQTRDARTYASEGQQRGLVLALRLAEFTYLRQSLGRVPLILADDVLGELDNKRKANFRKLLPPEAQVFATGTAYPSEDESAIWETFEVSSGTFSLA